MRAGTLARLAVVLVLLTAGFVFIWRTQLDPTKATLLVTGAIGAVTAIYALFTYEILLQNQAMAQAATDSTKVMERSLRFSYAPNLLYTTLNTKDPTLKSRKGFAAINNEDYERALKELAGGGQQMEFVFAVVQNVGRGPATNLRINAQYSVSDTSNPNKNYSIKKDASVQILQPENAIALCIYVSKVPTADDRVELVYAHLRTSDFYRDALGEPAQETKAEPKNHHFESEPGCILRIA
jgi:hypothetical protein